MIMKYFTVVLCILIANASAGNIDCKSIDLKKFNEIFNFKYKGGSRGLALDFGFDKNYNFKVEDCRFQITILWTALFDEPKSLKKQASKDKLNQLEGCSKYKVRLKIKNLASNKFFEYDNFVTTRPETATTKIQISLESSGENSANFSYSSTKSGCLTEYVAYVKDFKKKTVQNVTLSHKYFTIDSLTSSKPYTVQIIAKDDKGSKILSDEVEFKLTSNEVEGIDVELDVFNITSNSATLKWKFIDDFNTEELKLDFFVTVTDADGNKVLDTKTNNYFLNVPKLKACADYSAQIHDTFTSMALNFTTAYEKPSLPRKVQYSVNSTSSTISWLPPEVNPNCVHNYTIDYNLYKVKTFTDSKTATVIVPKSQTFITIDRLPYSKKVYINVNANYDTSTNATRKGTYAEFENFNIDDFVVTTIQEFRLATAEVQFQWGFDLSFNETKVLDYFEVFFDDKTIKTVKNLVNIKIKSCNRNYTVTIRCVSKAGTVGPNVTHATSLNDKEVPLSSIDMSNINVNQNSESINVTWMPNESEAACIAYYDVQFGEDVFQPSEPKMVIKKFDSCLLYQLSITPVSESGTRGGTTIYEFETNVLAPKQPAKPTLVYAGNRELKISTSISDIDKRCAAMTPTLIDFTCNGKVHEMLINNSQSHYTAVISHLHPNTKYECTVMLKNQNGTSEKSEAALFETQQDAPRPPDGIKTHAGVNSVNVSWIPNNSTGYADYFNIHVIFVKFLYSLGQNCHIPIKNKTVIEAVESTAIIQNLLPFSQYKLKIRASNVHGKSNFSEEVVFNTHPSSPTEPRDINVRFQTNDNSTISAFLSWQSPCMMNGKFSLYTISLNGTRKGVGGDKRTEANTIEEIVLHDLSPGFKYDVEVQAVNQKHGSAAIFGSVGKFSFVSPSGIPDEVDLKDWIIVPHDVSPTNINVLLRRKMLLSRVGDVTEIAFLIFLADCSDLPQPSFGSLPTDVSLPSAQTTLNCSELYQQTDLLSNPLNYEDEIEAQKFDEYTVKFTLGDADCSREHDTKYCNGPLKCHSCGLMARVFTSNGYRDTEPVYFDIKPQSPLLDPNTLYAVAGSMIILFLVSAIVCLLCYISIKRHKKKMKKKKEAAETVENLLSFTSYCVIDKNPTPKHQFDHIM